MEGEGGSDEVSSFLVTRDCLCLMERIQVKR